MAGFRTLELEVDSRVLIPRPETEGLVENVLAWAKHHSRWGVVADIGTGSGCIALALAVEGRFTRVVATDASASALAVARRNLERISPPIPVLLREGFLWEALEGERCEVIVSNPPYVSEAEFEALEPGVRLFEPRTALVSQNGGMEHIRQLLAGAGDYLAPLGLLALEVDSGRAEDARALATENGWSRVRVDQDLFGRPRYLLATWEQ
jgi:release factor glutamine methyltransferase